MFWYVLKDSIYNNKIVHYNIFGLTLTPVGMQEDSPSIMSSVS